jgi:hypothetical protein
MARPARRPHESARNQRDDVIDLTGAGTHNFLNESEDERRYQWSWWVPVAVAALIALLVIAVLLVS